MDLDDNLTRKVRRGISISQGNEKIVFEARTKILDVIEESTDNKGAFVKDATNHTFLLPNIWKYPFKFRAYLENDLIEQSVLMNLEQCDRLNWWCENDCIQRLWPLATTGDGNCLLHAASLAMWGFHDRHLTLRHALHHRLIHDNVAFYRRWVYQSFFDQKLQGFTLSRKEFEEEWSEICNLSFPSPKGSHTPFELSPKEYNEAYLSCCPANELTKGSSCEKSSSHSMPSFKGLPSKKIKTLPSISIPSRDSYYDFLEQIHIFVLSQVLRRPIIIISDTYVRDSDGQPIQPLLFGGIYLPLLEKPEDCEKSPIMLTYSNSHFSALVPMDVQETDESSTSSKKVPLAVPLIDPRSFELLPIHFNVDPGETWIKSNFSSSVKKPHNKTLLKAYLNCEEFKFCHKRMKHQSELVREDSLESFVESQKHSLTRSIGKQIKERFSSKTKSKVTSVRGDAASNKTQSINWEKLAENDSIFGAKIEIKVTSNYKEMIENFLKNAKSDFDVLQKRSRRASMEFMSKINADKENNQICLTSGCNIVVPLENLTCKLCSKCYNDKTAQMSNNKCVETSCISLATVEGYCLKCYTKISACRTSHCSSRALDNGLCFSCASKSSGMVSPINSALI